MIGLLALAASVALPSPYLIDTSTLAYVQCGDGVGTAAYLGHGQYITAAHVISGPNCKIDGKPLKIEQIDKKADWALFSSEAELPFYVVYSCDRLKEGEEYFSTGFAEGNPWPVTTRLIAEGWRDKGVSWSKGAIIAGMSGGEVLDTDGVLHAINDQYTSDGVPLSGVVELADTPLCKAKA